jgi:gamma-glutamylcyclotransferase (GGCT)/AIG2-like uncharacterized protein YtfP
MIEHRHAPTNAIERTLRPALFSYGTLRDRDLIAVVLGRRRRLPRRCAASLPDHRCVYVSGARYPVVVAAPGATATGVLLTGLRAKDWARLWFYESADYRLVDCIVTTAGGRRAAVMFAGGTTVAGEQPWSLRTWRLRHKVAALARIRRRMAAYSSHSPFVSRRPGCSNRDRSTRRPDGTTKSTQ